MIRTLFNEILKEAQNGLVIVDGDSWYVGFNSVVLEMVKKNVYLMKIIILLWL